MTGFHRPTNYHPEEGDRRGSEERKLPEFIYIETNQDYREEYFRENPKMEFGRTFESLTRKEYPLMLRLFCLVFAGFVLSFSLMVFFFVALFTLINLVTFFTLPQFRKRTKELWLQLKKLFVSGIGLLVAVISPPFGFAIIMVYFLLKGARMEEDWVSRVMSERFYRK